MKWPPTLTSRSGHSILYRYPMSSYLTWQVIVFCKLSDATFHYCHDLASQHTVFLSSPIWNLWTNNDCSLTLLTALTLQTCFKDAMGKVWRPSPGGLLQATQEAAMVLMDIIVRGYKGSLDYLFIHLSITSYDSYHIII